MRITRSIESIAGSFELEVSDRWAEQRESWAIAEEDACRVAIDEHVLVNGFVDRRRVSIDPQRRVLAYSGRDKAAAFVDNSAVLERWSFRNVDLVDFVAKLAAPFDVAVRRQEGLTFDKVAKVTISPGDSAFDVAHRLAQDAGALLVSDGEGNIVITRTGTTRAQPLVEGANIMAAAVTYDATERYRKYLVASQTPSLFGGEEAPNPRVKAEAVDAGVRRTSRVLYIRPANSLSTARARKRADWEARIRAARAETVNVTVQGWLQGDGVPWPVNALCSVRAPSIGVDGELLISQVEYLLDNSGQLAQLRLVRPDAFLPEPAAPVRDSGGIWRTGR